MAEENEGDEEVQDGDLPEWEVSELGQGAISLHEFFMSLLVAGFNESQALYLTARLLKDGNE